MDAVRFGRVLGFGARQAAKTVIGAVDAARAENPSGPTPAARHASTDVANDARSPAAVIVTSPAATPGPQRRAADLASHANRTTRSSARTLVGGGPTAARGMKEGFTRFRDSTVEPVVRLSGVLWLEVTGVFFGIFALSIAVGVVRLRPDWRAALVHPASHGGLFVAVAVFALFAYFAISSFVRARRREHRRG